MKVVQVDWVDSMSTQGWVHNHKNTDMRCTSVGILVFEDHERIKIALNRSWNSRDSYGDFMEIPKCSVKKRTILATIKERSDA